MIIFDAHCDTVCKLKDLRSDLYINNGHVDLARLKKYDSFIQSFAIFIDPAIGQAYALKRAIQLISEALKQFEIYNDDIMLCCNYNDITSAINNGKVAALLTLEGGDALQGDLAPLRIFYRLGVRSMMLTWNYRNDLADGVMDSISGSGLTAFGRQVVDEMNSLGMLIDVSHISDKGFQDIIDLSAAPVIASHSNARYVCKSPRNLTNEQILAIAQKGGVIGINLYPEFLNDSGKASLEDIIKHIEHICTLTGTDHIGLGCDFDGIDATPQCINGVQDIGVIFNELLKLNYPETFINKFAGENFLEVIKMVLC